MDYAQEQADLVRRDVESWLEAGRAGEDDGAPPIVDPEQEVSVWLALDAPERAKVADRLAALAAHRREGGRGKTARVAKVIGTGRANLYRLMKRMDQVGPVSGLVTQKRVQIPRSVIRDGFGHSVETWLLSVLEMNPEASPAEAASILRDEVAKAGEELALPSVSAIRRRMEHLRRDWPLPRATDVDLGARLLVDAGWLDMRVDVEGAEGPSSMQVRAIFAIDLSTGLICGHHAGIGSDEDLVAGMLGDLRSRIPALARCDVRVAERIGSIRWVVPAELADAAEGAGAYVPASRRPLLDLATRDVRRLDLDLAGVLGDRLGELSVRTRPARGRGRRGVDGLPRFAAEQEAWYVVHREVERFNMSRVERLLEQGSLLGNRARPANVARAEALQRDFVATFVSATSRDDDLGEAMRRAYPPL